MNNDTPGGVVTFWIFVVAMCLVTALMIRSSENGTDAASHRDAVAASVTAEIQTLRCNVGYLEVWVSSTYVISARCNPQLGAGYGQIRTHEMLVHRPGGALDEQIGAQYVSEIVGSVPEWAR